MSGEPINLAELERLAKAATPGPWRQGVTLDTPQMLRWSRDRRKANDEIEAARVFARFTKADHGRSRECVAVTHPLGPEATNAAYIAAVSPDVVLRLIGIIRNPRCIGSGRPYSAEMVARYQREWLALHSITDEAQP